MDTFTAIVLAFGLTTATAMLVSALSPRKPYKAKRKPVITPYRGPEYTRHGREVERRIEGLSRMVL